MVGEGGRNGEKNMEMGLGGIAPHKTEALVWQLVHGSATVKMELVKRGMMKVEDTMCPICKNELETVDHLFIRCMDIWKFWTDWCHQ